MIVTTGDVRKDYVWHRRKVRIGRPVTPMKHTFNRTLAAAAVAFAIVLVAGCDTTGPAPGTSPVVGTWRLVSVTIRATGVTLIVPGQFVFEADGDFLIELTYNGERQSESGTYVVDDSAARITTTTTMRNGQRVAGMALFDYVLDGDEADFIEPPESGSGATYHVRRVR